ncbi:MAG: serine--tRNA ligase, partial [Planctomycetota bacterium]|nr:serine--tRNA ligase [Planctomycetota bacterium]
MLDLEFIRKNPEAVRKAIRDKGDRVNLDEFLSIDKQRRETITRLDKLRNERRRTSEEVARLKRDKTDTDEHIR